LLLFFSFVLLKLLGIRGEKKDSSKKRGEKNEFQKVAKQV
jgi:hypothetical protein